MRHTLNGVSCPCCGHYIGHAAELSNVLTKFSGAGRILLDTLAKEPGTVVQKETLLVAIYGARATGADFPEDSLRSTVERTKLKLERYGWTIVGVGRGRGHKATYRLIPLTAGAQ